MLTSLIVALAFTLQSPDFANGATIPMAFVNNVNGCTGQNRPPQLRWNGVPANAKELALTHWDPDAPHPGGFVHWTVFGIPPSWRSLPAPLAPPAFAGPNSFGANGYGGPCPPRTTYEEYLQERRGHAIGVAKLIGRYGRP